MAFWVATPYSLVGNLKRCSETFCFPFQMRVSPNRWYLSIILHCVTSQKIIIVTHNEMRTPTSQMMFDSETKLTVLSHITVKIIHNNYTLMQLFPISAV
jgi:hypothetical protein